MGAWRIMGIESEYGISDPTDALANPMALSSQVVNSYLAPSQGARARWDYRDEAPLRDARGWDARHEAPGGGHTTEIPDDPGLANVILSNGARLYVDHAHPEYSSPEVTNPRDAVIWDKAGERIMQHAAATVSRTPGLNTVNVYKNNTDNKGASYGTHENYLMSRATPFADIVRFLTPFFVTRHVFAGAGRVGRGQNGHGIGFQISSRADFFETEVGLETTMKRPIINTRDEPHAEAGTYRRLHVIVGDATMSEIATYLKLGTTALVLDLIEQQGFSDAIVLADPVGSMHEISHDPSLNTKVRLHDGRKMTALEIQQWYLEQVSAHVDRTLGRDVDPSVTDVVSRWEQVLDRLAQDPMQCARQVDWVAKLRLLEGYRQRDGLDWNAARLQLVDLQWADVNPDKGLYYRLLRGGHMDRLVSDTEIEAAVTAPPHDTRAFFRGECVNRYGNQVTAASWDCVIFDVPGEESLQRVPTNDPHRGTREHVLELLDSCEDAEQLLAALGSR